MTMRRAMASRFVALGVLAGVLWPAAHASGQDGGAAILMLLGLRNANGQTLSSKASVRPSPRDQKNLRAGLEARKTTAPERRLSLGDPSPRKQTRSEWHPVLKGTKAQEVVGGKSPSLVARNAR